jgi:hypothetical protein
MERRPELKTRDILILISIILAGGVITVRIFATPVYWLLGWFVKNRLTRLIISGLVLCMFFSLFAFLPMMSPSQLTIGEEIVRGFICTIPCAAIWVLLEYRYGGSYLDQRRRRGLPGRRKKSVESYCQEMKK